MNRTMDFPAINPVEFTTFLLILVRISIILFLAPIFGSDLVPIQVKAALSLMLALILAPGIRFEASMLPEAPLLIIPLILGEVFVGLSITIIIRLLLEGVQLAGQYIGYQMGFAIVNVVDPQSGNQASVLSQFAYIIALVVFLSVNGHYIILKGLVESFDLAPPGRMAVDPVVLSEVTRGVSRMFIIAIKIGAPAMAVLFFTKVAMGIVAKTVPQMNVLFVGMPLYIIIGLFVLGLSLNYLVPILGRATHNVDQSILTMLRSM